MENVFHTTYIPVTDNEIALSAKKQNFAYSVLEHTLTLKTEVGRMLIHTHQTTKNAQQIWTKFTNDAKQSTTAQLSQSELLCWIPTAKYDSNWRGIAFRFILDEKSARI
jgi:hypothetical protein